MRRKRIAIFASGSGTNAGRILSHFRGSELAEVSILLSNKPDAGALDRASGYGVRSRVFDRTAFYESDEVLNLLLELKIDLIALAGFLWLIPPGLLAAFPGRIVNIHPALLPRYGGKGMYGRHVHEAVISSGDRESGISIHYVNEVYDAGKIIFREKCEVRPDDTPDSLADRIHELEYRYYPEVLEKLIKEMD